MNRSRSKEPAPGMRVARTNQPWRLFIMNRTARSPFLKNIWRTPHAISPKPMAASNMRSQDSLTSLRKPMQIPHSTSAATSLIIFGANP